MTILTKILSIIGVIFSTTAIVIASSTIPDKVRTKKIIKYLKKNGFVEKTIQYEYSFIFIDEKFYTNGKTQIFYKDIERSTLKEIKEYIKDKQQNEKE